jgi:Xaa-Pro aminopeptidase
MVSGVDEFSTEPTPFIPRQEYALRIERLKEGMRGQKLDAILLGTGMNLQYFSGFPSPARNVARPFFLVVPANGDPVLITHIAFGYDCEHLAVTQDIRTYKELAQVPISALLPVLDEVKAHFGRIGMELGFEQSLDLSQFEFLRLQEALAGAELIDVASLLWRLRMIKSASEIDCIRHACDIVARGYSSTFAASRVGMNERTIFRVMQNELFVLGSDTFLVSTSGEGNYDMISKPADDRTVLEGDMVWMDAGCRVDGYWSDYSRAAVAGSPSDAQNSTQAAIAKITADTIAEIRPGKRCSEIARFALERLAQLDVPITSSLAERAARIGHGIGLNMTEPPHLGLHDDTVLEPGMVVSVEPGVATRYGTFHVEEDVVVRDGECEILSTSPRTLQIIAS